MRWRAAALCLGLATSLFVPGCKTPVPSPPRRDAEAKLPAPPPEVLQGAAGLEQARALWEQGDAHAARRVLSAVSLDQLPAVQRRETIRLHADLARDFGEWGRTLYWLAWLQEGAPESERVALKAELEGILSGQSLEELEAAGRELDRREPASELWLWVARRALQQGERDRATAALEQLDSAALSPQQRAWAERLAVRLGKGSLRDPRGGAALPPLRELSPLAIPREALVQVRGAVGVALPLTGPVAHVGEQTLRGILLAAGIFDPRQVADPDLGGGLRVLVRDTRGDPERAAAAVREFSARGDVVAVIGPLLRDEVEAAAVEAQRVEMPLLTVTRREAVAADRDHVFRFGLTRRAEAAALARYAVERFGIERVAILYPRDDYGLAFRSLVWKALEARGSRVVGVMHYPPQATDFAAPIRSLVGYDFLSAKDRELVAHRDHMLQRARRLSSPEAKALRAQAAALRLVDGAPLPPRVDFEALFLPDAHDKVGLIVPQLAFHRIQGVRLFGPSGWHHPELLTLAGRHVSGAFFSSGFAPTYPSPLVRGFAQRYRAIFGENATVFAAQAYDAANLVQLQLWRGAETPDAVRRGLLATELYAGVSGSLAIESDGNALRRPFVFEVHGRTVRVED